MISYYYSGNYVIILHVLGIKDVTEVEVISQQFGIKIEINIQDNLLGQTGNSIVLELLSNPMKTWIEMPQR